MWRREPTGPTSERWTMVGGHTVVRACVRLFLVTCGLHAGLPPPILAVKYFFWVSMIKSLCAIVIQTNSSCNCLLVGTFLNVLGCWELVFGEREGCLVAEKLSVGERAGLSIQKWDRYGAASEWKTVPRDRGSTQGLGEWVCLNWFEMLHVGTRYQQFYDSFPLYFFFFIWLFFFYGQQGLATALLWQVW